MTPDLLTFPVNDPPPHHTHTHSFEQCTSEVCRCGVARCHQGTLLRGCVSLWTYNVVYIVCVGGIHLWLHSCTYTHTHRVVRHRMAADGPFNVTDKLRVDIFVDKKLIGRKQVLSSLHEGKANTEVHRWASHQEREGEGDIMIYSQPTHPSLPLHPWPFFSNCFREWKPV